MNEAIEHELYELEELIASLSIQRNNAETLRELNLSVMRLKQAMLSQCEELYNDPRPLPMGGEVSS